MKNTLVLAGLLSLCGQCAFGFPQAAQIKRGKAATALVDLAEFNSSATAFCVLSSGIFVTNYHVVEDLPDEADIPLVLNSGTDEERTVIARTIAIDKKNDLAILRTQKKGKFPTLDLGDETKLFETADLVVYGFPFGKGLSVDKESYPAMSVNRGAVTAIRKENDATKLIQFDADVNPGNSGGPVCNEDGEVVAVVSFGLQTTSLNFAIPAAFIKALLVKPKMEITLPTLTGGNIGRRAEVKVTLKEGVEPIKDPNIELELQLNGVPRTVKLNPENGTFIGSFVPDKAAKSGLLGVDITRNGETTSVKGRDQSIRVNGKRMFLSDIALIKPLGGKKARIRWIDGKQETVELTGIDPFRDASGKRHDLLSAQSTSIHSLRAAPSVSYTFVLKSGNTEISRERRTVGGLGNTFLAHRFSGDRYIGGRRVIDLPAEISNVTRAFGGRILLLELPGVGKLAVFDGDKGAITGTLPLPKDALVVGSSDYVFIFDPATKLIRRWQLATLQKEREVRIDSELEIVAMAAGYTSQLPILVRFTGKDHQSPRYGLIDQITLELVEAKGMAMGTASGGLIDLCPDGLGVVFTARSNKSVRRETILVLGNRVVRRGFPGRHYAVPTAGGNNIVSDQGINPTAGFNQPQMVRSPSGPCVPSNHPRLFLALLDQKEFKAQGDVHINHLRSMSPQEAIAPLPPLRLGEENGDNFRMHLAKRVHYLATSGLLLTIPYNNKQLILQPYHIPDILAAAERDALFVLSLPPAVVERGTTWAYRCRVFSTRLGIRYRISKGPKGMSVSLQDGLLRWRVPKNLEERKVEVHLEISDASGKTITDVFALTIVDRE